MTRIGTAYGASPLTFLSLAGVGDLFLTCSSTASRNYTVGYRLGQGEKLDDIVKTLGSVAEGVTTAKGLKEIIDTLGLRAQIATAVCLDLGLSAVYCSLTCLMQVYEVLYEGAWVLIVPMPRIADNHDRERRGRAIPGIDAATANPRAGFAYKNWTTSAVVDAKAGISGLGRELVLNDLFVDGCSWHVNSNDIDGDL